MKKNYKIKKCITCKKDFRPNSGIQKNCSIKCVNSYIKKYSKKRYENTKHLYKKEKKEYLKKYRKINKNKLKILKHEYYENNKVKILEQHRQYRKNHIYDIQKYKLINKEKLKKYNLAYYKNRLKHDINFRIAHYLRTRIVKVIKNNTKLLTTMNLIGTDILSFKKYLQKRFKKGMSWKNYGKWHIDHIRPCASFDLSKPSEQRKCFHYTNLQPLWAKENLRKGSRF